MRQVFILLFSTGFIFSLLNAQETHLYNPVLDVQHYDFSIELSDQNDEIKASSVVTVLFLQATGKIELDLTAKNDKGRGMNVTSVEENKETLAFEHTADRLKIKLNSAAKAGETRLYKIEYNGIPADGLVFSKNKFGARTIFGDNWPNRAHNWLPCVDQLSDKASVDFMVTAPDHYQVISNGTLTEESYAGDHKKFTHWKETAQLPTKVMVIGLADFAVNYPGLVDCIPVSSWVFPPDKKNGFYDYAQAMEILPFFIKQVGPYAYPKLANVEAITIFGGMENAGAIFYNERSITGTRGSSEELMAHEIAHQWFGNAVTESDWPHVWLSEGFATGMANLYLEHKYGADTLKARLRSDRALIVQFARTRFTPVVDSSENKNFLALLNNNSYAKGGWVLHMLRRKLGDSIFWKGIRSYYATYAGRNANTDNFRTAMEEVSQTDLGEFFNQWLYVPGQPVLQMTWKYDENKKLIRLRILQQQKHLFSFPLEFGFLNNITSKNIFHSFLIKEKTTELQIAIDTRPAQVIADPDVNLLFKGSISEEN